MVPSMRLPSLLLALALLAVLLPPPAAAASQTDPAGDETYAPGRRVLVPTPCHSPKIDITEASATSDGATVTLSIEVLDVDAPFACTGDAAGLVQGWETLWMFVLSGPGDELIFAYAQPDYAGGHDFRYKIGNDNAGEATGPTVGGVTGNVLAWTIPLTGVRPGTTEAYDYRGLTFGTEVYGYEDAIVGPPQTFLLAFHLFDTVALGPVTV